MQNSLSVVFLYQEWHCGFPNALAAPPRINFIYPYTPLDFEVYIMVRGFKVPRSTHAFEMMSLDTYAMHAEEAARVEHNKKLFDDCCIERRRLHALMTKRHAEMKETKYWVSA